MTENEFTCEPSIKSRLGGHRASVTALFFNPNGKQLASSSLDYTIRVWDHRPNMRSYRYKGHSDAVTDVTFSPGGEYMASSSYDKTIRIWEPKINGNVWAIEAHSQPVRSVQFNFNGTQIISASDDQKVTLWSTYKTRFLTSFMGHTGSVRCARMSIDGSIIASCSEDKTTRLWSPESGKTVHTYVDQRGFGLYVAWHPCSCYVAVATSHGKVKIYDVRTHRLLQHYSIHKEAVNQIAFHPSGSYILTASKDGTMKILDLTKGSPLFTLLGHDGAINAVNFSYSGKTFSSAGDDKLVFVWQTNFAHLVNEDKENLTQNSLNIMSNPSSSTATQGAKAWYLCYHNTKLPVATYVHRDDVQDAHDSIRFDSFSEELPNANSTLNTPRQYIHSEPCIGTTYVLRHAEEHSQSNISCQMHRTQSKSSVEECTLHDVGHTSHIPRIPPSQATYTIPSFTNKSVITINNNETDFMFGMIKLRDNDVCYTSGTIEWVGRKRSYPINSGFKVLTDHNDDLHQSQRKIRRKDKSFSLDISKLKDCDCADVLPTVNAIVDHLNALHEAVDLVDLRLNTLEDSISKSY